MMLADHGAEMIRIDRANGSRDGSQPVTWLDVLARGRKSIAIDLKCLSKVCLLGL
jgi:alpha-methylacyl-CoA racemase